MESPSHESRLVVDVVKTVRDNFWLQNPGLSEAELEQQWRQQPLVAHLAPMLGVSTSPTNINDHFKSRNLKLTPDLAHQPHAMIRSPKMSRRRTDQPRSQSSKFVQGSSESSRKRANSSNAGIPALSLNGASIPGWRDSQPFLEPTSGRNKMQRTASGSRPLPSVREIDAKDYDPEEYLRNNDMEFESCLSSPTVPDWQRLSNTQNLSYIGIPGSSVPVSESPSNSEPLSSPYQSFPQTPELTGAHNGAFVSPMISRQGSLGMDFHHSFTSMVRLDSHISNSSEYPTSRSLMPSNCSEENTYEGPNLNGSPFFEMPTVAVSSALSSRFNSYPPQPVSPCNATNSSPLPSPPQPICLASTERPLKPKPTTSEVSATLFETPRTMCLSSRNGNATKYPIPAAPCTRPAKKRFMCDQCDRQPNGFKGEHELRRHRKLSHEARREGFICIDPSGGTRLDACKHCRGKKVYNAYYNAAAHLRRLHFHPRGSDEQEESRAGKGGGQDPPMEELKRWMKKVEVINETELATEVGAEDNDSDCEDSPVESHPKQTMTSSKLLTPTTLSSSYQGYVVSQIASPHRVTPPAGSKYYSEGLPDNCIGLDAPGIQDNNMFPWHAEVEWPVTLSFDDSDIFAFELPHQI